MIESIRAHIEVVCIPAELRQQHAFDDALRLLATLAIRAAQNGERAANSADSATASTLTSGRGEVMYDDGA
jgi:hypothetical protein